MKLHAKNASRRWRTRTMMAVAAATGSAVMLIAAPGAAQADSSGTHGNNATNLCLDGNEVGNVYTSSCSASPWMAWMETSTPLGARQLKSSATGRCLDSNHDGAVYTLPCDANNPYQNWRFDPDRPTRIQNFATNHCLDSNHARQVYATPCQENNLHQWWG
jgi:hypothetical protein